MTLPKNNQPLFVLVDGSSYLHRAFHALPPLHTPQGMPTGAIYGVTSMLKSLLADYQPTHAAVVFDAGGKTFRDELSTEYKANRPTMVNDLVVQIKPLQEIIQALGFHLFVEHGVEADDVIGTLAIQAEQAEMQVLIFSGDKDFAQLVSPHITLIDTMKNQRLDEQGVEDKFGISPALFVDYLSLVGDSVDNVAGVKKIGPKTAVKLLKEHGSLENLMAHADQLAPKIRQNLHNAADRLPLNRQLLTIRQNVPLAQTPQTLVLKPADTETLQQWFSKLSFKQWLADLPVPKQDFSHYQTILTETQFNDWLQRLDNATLIAFNVTAVNLENALETRLIGLAFAVETGSAAYLPLAHDELDAPPQLAIKNVLSALKPLLENPEKLKVTHHAKNLLHVFANYNIQLQGVTFDTLLASYVLNSTADHELSVLAQQYLQITPLALTQLLGKGKKQLSFNQLDIQQATHYAAQQVDLIWQLQQILTLELQKVPTLFKLFKEIEMPLTPLLVRMERQGVKIDGTLLYTQSQSLNEHLEALTAEVYELAGETFNLNSPKQLQTILFDKLQLTAGKKTAKGQQSTSESVLEELAEFHPLPRLILTYRQLSKLKSTYTDALPKQISPRSGRLHTSYQQAVTVTGRLSSISPNLQNIPIRSEEGRRIRQAFVAPKGYQLLAADYSQIELRIMAHLSADENLLSAFQKNEDIHRYTAADIFSVDLDAVSAEQRRKAKAVNFGLIYGMSAFGLAQQLDIRKNEAADYIEIYFTRYPKVKTYMEETRELAKTQGFVETVSGRRLYIPEIRSTQHQRQQYAERAAINAPLQGTAADVMKLAMLAVDHWLAKSGLDIKVIMQIHDELVLEIKDDAKLIAEAKSTISQLMSQVVSLKVPLLVNISVGKNWDEAH